jgi:heme exporter protein C
VKVLRSPIFGAILFAWLAVVIWAAYLWAPPALGFLANTDRILYFHVPSAWAATLAFLVCAAHSVAFLRKGREEDDRRAAIAARLGLLFTALATISGSIWAKVMWNAYWNWDPRQSSIVMLMLIYAAYLALRESIDDPERRGRLSAGYALLAVVTVPFLVFIVPRLLQSLHPQPVVNVGMKREMNSRMLQVLIASFGGFTALFFWIYALEDRIEALRERLDHHS